MSSPFTSPSGPTWSDALLSLLVATDTFEEFLHELTVATAAALPEGSMCGLTVVRGERAVTIASSDDLTLAVDQIQYRTGEGPCLDTLSSGQAHHTADTSTEPRWRSFCTEAFAHGVRSCLALPLMAPGGQVGGYNLYNPRPGAFGDDVLARMNVFAGTAAGAVALSLRLADQSRLNADLRATLASRSVIDQAVGIVMAQQRCPPEEAFALLSRASQNRNLKIRDLAAEIVTTVGGRPSGPDAFDPPE
ncbi:GAF and ANTAR domain-containing protein [Streptosporangium longisporum]|uniref:GAF and ANTAR domain-containing protein n=1 Tax=Streptosporangium longisporum TaxID=46187 RepID=A0ABP6L729_9ACTN